MSTPANQSHPRRKQGPTSDGLFTIRLASVQVLVLGGLLAVCSIPLASGVTALLSLDMAGTVNRVLGEAGVAASWVLPMCMSALIAGIAVIYLPDWRARAAIGRVELVDSAEVRRLIGNLCLGVALALFIWMIWIVLAWLVPGWSPGSLGAGTLIGLVLTLTLALLGSRASLGTREQRRSDARTNLVRLRVKAAHVHSQTIHAAGRAASWPVVSGVAVLLAPALLALLFGIFGIVEAPTAWTIFVYLVALCWIPLAFWVETLSRCNGTQCVASVFAILATLFTACVSALLVIVDTEMLTPGLCTLVLTLVPLLNLIRWRGKYLLAALGLHGLRKSIASTYAYLGRLQTHA